MNTLMSILLWVAAVYGLIGVVVSLYMRFIVGLGWVESLQSGAAWIIGLLFIVTMR